MELHEAQRSKETLGKEICESFLPYPRLAVLARSTFHPLEVEGRSTFLPRKMSQRLRRKDAGNMEVDEDLG